MEIFIYFAFGLLNVYLLLLFNKWYKKSTSIETFNKTDEFINILACFVSGPFGTILIFLLGLFFLYLWRKYYRKK